MNELRSKLSSKEPTQGTTRESFPTAKMANDHNSHVTPKKVNVNLDKPKRTMRVLPGTGTKATARTRRFPLMCLMGQEKNQNPRTN
jgi:hypothetical protein